MPLNQGDFVLTLVAVFWEEGRAMIDDFCKKAKTIPDAKTKYSPFNHVIQPDAQGIVRAAVGLRFKRGRMREAYAILKGRDPDTNKYSSVLREKQFAIFKESVHHVIDTSNWHGFLKIIVSLGYKSTSLVASDLALINTYIFYLIGKLEFQVDYKKLEREIGRWFFMASITSRYSGSSESITESDLNKVKLCKNAGEFLAVLTNTIESTLTNDFWEITLPNDLMITSNSSSPVMNAFVASLIKEKTNALFSQKSISDLFDPQIKIKKKSLDRHHIFPKDYLKGLNFTKIEINQIANLTYLEYLDNIKISNQAPRVYYPEIKSKYYNGKELTLESALTAHCIPNDFYLKDYQVFLLERRNLMARFLKKEFEKL